MVTTNTISRRSALALVAGGGVILASETFGYSFIDADRITSIGAADNENALIALVEASYDVVPNNAFETVAHLTNNVSDDVDVIGYEISTNQDGVSIRFNGEESAVGGTLTGSLTMTEGDAEPVDLECSKPGQIVEGDEILTVRITEVQGVSSAITIEDIEFNLEFLCKGGAILEIPEVRGLADSRSFEDFQPDVDVEETGSTETQNLSVRLQIVGDTEGTVFDETKQAPGDFAEIKGETLTVSYDVGQLAEDSYSWTATANADNATETTATGAFEVDDELLIIDLAGSRTGARDLAVDALNRSGETLELVAVAIEHDPDNEATRNRTEFETLEIDVGGDGIIEVSEGSKQNPLPGDGTRIDHASAFLMHDQVAEYSFNSWDGGGNIKGETFEITIWAVDGDGNEVPTTDRVTVPS